MQGLYSGLSESRSPHSYFQFRQIPQQNVNQKMKNSGKSSNDGGRYQKSSALAPVNNNKMKKNKARMGSGGGGLSLQTFANAKSKNDGYNPALIKKQREFYKNAKCVNKYKKSIKQQNEEHGSSQSTKSTEGRNDNRGKRKTGNKLAYSLNEIYNKKKEEEEKARMEKEAVIKSRQEEKEKSEARRKAQREKMFKRTRSGQPIMKYRIEHLLQTIQGTKD